MMNYTTLPFYWGHYEREEGKPDSAYASKAAQWCRKNGIIPKGHPLTWHDSPVAWLRDKSPDQALDLQLGRIEREVGAFAGLIDKWDVANESILWPRWDELAPPEIAAKDHIHKIVKKTGRTELLKKCFAAARNANPQAALVLNDGGYHSFYQVVQACPKPSYQALKSLIRDEWWTGRSAFVTDENGRSSFRGFLGQYQLTCRDGAAGFSVSEKGQCQVKMTMP